MGKAIEGWKAEITLEILEIRETIKHYFSQHNSFSFQNFMTL